MTRLEKSIEYWADEIEEQKPYMRTSFAWDCLEEATNTMEIPGLIIGATQSSQSREACALQILELFEAAIIECYRQRIDDNAAGSAGPDPDGQYDQDRQDAMENI